MRSSEQFQYCCVKNGVEYSLTRTAAVSTHRRQDQPCLHPASRFAARPKNAFVITKYQIHCGVWDRLKMKLRQLNGIFFKFIAQFNIVLKISLIIHKWTHAFSFSLQFSSIDHLVTNFQSRLRCVDLSKAQKTREKRFKYTRYIKTRV